METDTRLQSLRAGQALTLDRRAFTRAVLVDGKARAQAQARWLAGTVVLPGSRAVDAGEAVEVDGGLVLVATTDAKVVLHEAVSPVAAGIASALRGLADLLHPLRPSVPN